MSVFVFEIGLLLPSVLGSIGLFLLGRRLRMAAVWAGPGAVAAFRAGDGAASVTVELTCEHATAVLSLLVNPANAELRQADITL